jgi:hypothetical protein
MRRTLHCLLSAAVVLGFAFATRAADDDVKAILARAIKAHGGEEALTKHQAGQTKSKGKLTIPGLGETDFTSESAFMLPDKFKETVDLEVMGKKINVVTIANGDQVSIDTTVDGNNIPVKITDEIKDALKEQQYMMKAARLVALTKDKSFQLEPLGEVKVEGKPAVGIRVSSKGHKDLSLYFNKDTGLLAKSERRSVEPMSGKEFTEERIILDYEKTKEGIPLPKKVLVKHDGEKHIEAEIVEAKWLEKLDESEFKK